MRLSHKGFSLMEIMVIVAVLALLAAIAVPNFVNAKRKAETNFCVNNLSILDTAKKQWARDNKIPTGQLCRWDDIKPYIPEESSLSSCPAGGSYTIGPVGAKPVCSTGKDHRL